MGFKSIEMQIAIPRSQDAGKMQEQLMRQGQQFQETLTQQQLREEITNRSKVNEYENVQDSTEDKENKEEQGKKKKHSKKVEDESGYPINHPYLGKNIDFSG